ncbi:MAG TPA: DEAD/DEAH box helicase [Acidimicrobiales bacterium]|nr:DEAD/DEAH box helicase [Acidimicrobiales bacterium]
MTSSPWPVQETAGPAEFEAGLPFALDDFQHEAFRALDAGQSVLVSAPTGSGKTLVAAYAVHRALCARGKAFYTTPLKALSNQKYNELVATYGVDHVGLLTGDTTLRPRAPVVVMTTEVLRNMLLAGSDLLEGLHTVVLDEVHFIQDPYRGGVWEEVLVLSPPEVRFVCLSATVNNAHELGGWLRSVRGDTAVIVERLRPIILRHHFAVHRREHEELAVVPLLQDNGRPGDEGMRIDQAVRRALQGRPASWRPRGRGPRLPFRPPTRTEMIEELEARDMLPAIVFIFSRAACDDAVRQVVRDGVRLTDAAERVAIRQVVERRVDPLSDEDLRVLGYGEWLDGLERGVAAHHAGLVPVFRETVEECFEAGLLKVVFATETLSLGINMPARSVVIERFTKYGNAGRAMLTSGEYLQLTGRAGRRGLDEEGHAVVAWSSEITFDEAARVAAASPPDLRSSFRPTYNLAVNLVARFDRDTAHAVLRRSFAQWQARSPDLLERQLEQRMAVLESMGYLEGWELTTAGRRLSRLYHEADLLVAEALGAGVLTDAEPSVLAGVLSAVVFEPRRARRVPGHHPHHGPRRGKRRAPLQDRLGDKRLAELAWRGQALAAMAESIRAAEEAHRVPRTRQPAPGLATAVASWARGAPFAVALEVAARDVGELAPGDFVRTMKSVADLAQQVSHTAPDPGVAAAAREAVELLVRGVVAGGLPGT